MKVKGMEKGDKVVCIEKGHFHYHNTGTIVSVDRDHTNIFQYKVEFVLQRLESVTHPGKKLTTHYESWLYPNMVQSHKEWNRNKNLEELGV
jgi:hypothetical protein